MFKLHWQRDWDDYAVIWLDDGIYLVRYGRHAFEAKRAPLVYVDQETLGM